MLLRDTLDEASALADPFTVVTETVNDRYRQHLLCKAPLRRCLDHALLRFQRGVSLEFDVNGEFLGMPAAQGGGARMRPVNGSFLSRWHGPGPREGRP
jgi:hypothetical protein